VVLYIFSPHIACFNHIQTHTLVTMAVQRKAPERAQGGIQDDTSGIKAAPVIEGNLRHLKGTIPGPSGTPHEGGSL
jgi:ubiquitin-protein ligase